MRLIDADKLKPDYNPVLPLDSWLPYVVQYISMYQIDHAPTIEAEPVKRGRWTEHPREREWDVCSCCKTGTKRREYGMADGGKEWVTEYGYKYCPWCGARMEKRNDE